MNKTIQPTIYPVRCLACGKPLSPEQIIIPTEDFRPCRNPQCRKRHRVISFPALLRPQESGQAGEQIQEAGEATCFYHPDRRATVVCEGCGRFLCAFCDLSIKDQHICPSCLNTNEELNKGLQNSRTRYDSIALTLALLVPIVMFPLMVISAPIVLFLTFRYWNKPCSLVEKSRWRLAVAALFAVAELVLVGLFLGTL